ncbi:phytanoyl-CoA dioxygenase [Azospirillum sp. 412522]|nr:phytanoyl-CoA dioxygenase [Azospirillum sp. 412522]
MPHSTFTLPDFTEVGALGVVGLKRIWARQISGSRPMDDEAAREWRAIHVLTSGLQVGLEELHCYLGNVQPSFASFEDWIVQRNGGSIDRAVAERINAALTGRSPPPAASALAAEIDAMDPVLDADDLAHWEEHGWVILHDSIAPEACRATAQAVWDELGKSPDDPASWDEWTDQQQCVFIQLYRHPALDANRRSRRIHKALAQLWGTADLWVSTDRVGFNPPVTPCRAFPGPGIHWDVNLTRPIPLGIQGLIYLTDTAAHQGAFGVIPGMHRTIDAWLDSVPPGVSPRMHAAEHLTLTPIAGRAGDLILWHHALAHGPTPNHAERPRLVHYLTMFPSDFPWTPGWL